jgi:hypothetical protein
MGSSCTPAAIRISRQEQYLHENAPVLESKHRWISDLNMAIDGKQPTLNSVAQM